VTTALASCEDADMVARELLYELVSIPSPTGEEGNAAERLAAFFEVNDREVWLDEVGNVRAPADDSVLLTSHIDTVPGEIPVRVEERDDVAEYEADGPVLWGRGAVDATGPLVAMAVAAVRTGVSFAGVVGEEVDSRGARHLVETRDAPDAVINGEPTGWDGVALGYRGILSGTYVATSESSHSSRPEPNAIQDALAWWSRLADWYEHDSDGPTFEQVTAKPVSIEGGGSEDGLSVEATLDVQLRIPPQLSVADVRATADAALDTGRVNWRDGVPPVTVSPRSEPARVFRVAVRDAGGDPRLLRKTGTSDMNLFDAWDVPMATYGPGDSALDHAPDERLPLAELDRATGILETVTTRL